MTQARCLACADFVADPAELERLFPGLGALSSGDASVRAGDGLCRRHDRYLPGRAGCAFFRPADDLGERGNAD